MAARIEHRDRERQKIFAAAHGDRFVEDARGCFEREARTDRFQVLPRHARMVAFKISIA
jgi:hypothetical protein